jgi:hypothetical protein
MPRMHGFPPMTAESRVIRVRWGKASHSSCLSESSRETGFVHCGGDRLIPTRHAEARDLAPSISHSPLRIISSRQEPQTLIWVRPGGAHTAVTGLGSRAVQTAVRT